MSQVLIEASSILTQKEAEMTEREHAEAEANANEIRWKLREHQQRFMCHIGGCEQTSAGPTLDQYLGHWLWDWKQPTELALCDRCIRWTCLAHLSGGFCQDCRASRCETKKDVGVRGGNKSVQR